MSLFFLFLLMFFLYVPCINSQQQINVQEVVEAEVAKEEEGSGKLDVKLFESKKFEYNPVGRRDPFKSFIIEIDQERQGNTAKNHLLRFALSELKLIGIMSNIPVPKAMMEDPTGKGWIVKIGTSIGKHFGKIKRITDNAVIIVEEYHDRFGKLTINEVEMRINEDI